jgi:hypothetical protein
MTLSSSPRNRDTFTSFVRKGYRFMGRAVIHEPGSVGFARGVDLMSADGSELAGRVRAIIVADGCRRPGRPAGDRLAPASATAR